MSPGHLFTAMLRASIEGGALLILLWIVVRFWPSVPATTRRVWWWCGALRMILGLLPMPRFTIAPLPAFDPLPDYLPVALTTLSGRSLGSVAIPSRLPVAISSFELLAVVFLTLWLAGVVLGIVRMSRRMLALRRVWNAARPASDPRITAWRTEWALVLGHGGVPEIRESGAIETPLAFGGLRSGVLLPIGCERLPDDTLRLVIAHELSHVRRRDPLLAWVPALAEQLFWFHPLVRFAGREYLAAREEVCDADALRATGASPQNYGALLLEFGTGRAWSIPGTASCGSLDGRHLKRRLGMLSNRLTATRAQRAGIAILTLVLIGLGFAPVRFVQAREARFSGTIENASRRSPIAFMIKTRGEKGTRGSVDEYDLVSARRLERIDVTTVYFRLGDRAWTSSDDRTLAEVRSALEPEDRLDARESVVEQRRAVLEAEQQKLELKREALELRRTALEERRAALEERLERAREEGGSTRELRAQALDLGDEREVLDRARAELSEAREQLSSRLKAHYQADKSRYAERDALHERVLEEVARIARAAVADGRAEPFVP